MPRAPFARLILSVLMLGAAACGVPQRQDPGTVTEYYVEEGDFSSDGTKKPGGGDTGQDGGGDGGQDGADDGGDGLALRFVSPEEPQTGGGVVTVVIELANAPADATWSLFYAAEQGAAAGTAIAADLPASEMSVDWDTTGLAEGTYYLYAEVAAGGAVERFAAAATVTVAAAKPGENRKPTVKITAPNGEDVYVAGTAKAVTFAATDADGDALTYEIEYSADGGTTWTMLAEGLTETTFQWDVQGLAQGIDYRVRVTADDGKAGATAAVSAKAFGVAATAPTFAGSFGAMLAQRCNGCHAQGRPNSGVFRSDSLALANTGVADSAAAIKADVDTDKMPPGNPLGAADRVTLQLWLWNGNQ